MKTKVVFKKIHWFNGENPIVEINAIFPEHSSTDREGDVLYQGYAHIGQHCEFHEDFLNNSSVGLHKVETATEEEYKDLKTELESIGYELVII
jgi:hypothetical protein